MASKLKGMTKSLQTVYKRPLSSQLISFSSQEGRQLFKEAMLDGYMQNYFPLSEQFTTQAEPAYCGPASLTMILNTLSIDPQKTWKGIWRWYDEGLLTCTTKDRMAQGFTLEEMTLLGRCNGLHTQTYRASSTSVAEALIRSKVPKAHL